MIIALNLVFLLTGTVSVGASMLAFEGGLVASLLTFWTGGMIGASALLTILAVRPGAADCDERRDSRTSAMAMTRP